MSVQPVNIKPIIIGLTGGIASGKSTAAQIFSSLDIPVIDSDHIVHDLWKNNLQMIEKIEQTFGFSMASDGRKKLAKLIFESKEDRQKLNQIVHPYVFHTIEEEKCKHANHKVIVIDMPLLFEVDYQDQCDEVCLVYVDETIQLERLMLRDQITKDEAMIRIKSQMPIEEKRRLADVIFDNSQTIADLKEQIESYIRGLLHEE